MGSSRNTTVALLLILSFLAGLTGGCSIAGKTVRGSDEIDKPLEEPVIRVMVASRHGRRIVKMPMETYLVGVIGNEMSKRWPIEALKAQTVAARSYALYRMDEARKSGRSFDLVASQGDQVFRHKDSRDPYLTSIVEQTRGEVLWSGGRAVQAFYSSTCGGRTRSPESAGLSSDSPIRGFRTDFYCKRSPFRNWMISTTLEDLAKLFRKKGFKVADLRAIRIQSKDRAGYVKSVEIADARGERALSGDEFRSLMGSMRLKSLLFDLKNGGEGTVSQGTVSQEIHFFGRGFGHGVGMCQYGAERMATQGRKYRSILSKYYPGIQVVKIY